jgi:hypothetical protein
MLPGAGMTAAPGLFRPPWPALEPREADYLATVILGGPRFYRSF